MKKLIIFSGLLLFIFSCQEKASDENKDTSNQINQPTNPQQNNTNTNTNTPINAQIIEDGGQAKFAWTNEGGTVWNFGTIEQGDEPKFNFTFTNTGTEPMIISNAKGSCGCTVPDWPKEPIAPGATGEIQVKFNSKNKKGAQNKTVTITANTTPPTTKLRVTGQINVNE